MVLLLPSLLYNYSTVYVNGTAAPLPATTIEHYSDPTPLSVLRGVCLSNPGIGPISPLMVNTQ